MNEHQFEEHRHRLRAIVDRLHQDISGLRDAALHGSGGETSGGLSNAPLHLADLATDASEQNVALGLLQNQQEVLNKTIEALNRLEAGTFGRCEQCGEQIPEERLQAIYYASRCIQCERQAEGEGFLPKIT